MSIDFTTDRFNYYLLAARIATAKFNGRVSKQRLFGTVFGRWGWLEGGGEKEKEHGGFLWGARAVMVRITAAELGVHSL